MRLFSGLKNETNEGNSEEFGRAIKEAKGEEEHKEQNCRIDLKKVSQRLPFRLCSDTLIVKTPIAHSCNLELLTDFKMHGLQASLKRPWSHIGVFGVCNALTVTTTICRLQLPS